jgi:uncharacterized repeat protein (TIGR01451 family)
VALKHVQITDALAEDLECTEIDIDNYNPEFILQPNQMIHCTATKSMTLTMIDECQYYNEADYTSIALDPSGTTVSGSAHVNVLIERNPAIKLVKSGKWIDSMPKNGVAAVGETIEYTFTLTNSGNTRLDNIEVTDALIPNINCSTVPKPFLTDTDATCTGKYILKPNDPALAAYKQTNTAAVTATIYNDKASTVHAVSTVVVILPGDPAETSGTQLSYWFEGRNTDVSAVLAGSTGTTGSVRRLTTTTKKATDCPIAKIIASCNKVCIANVSHITVPTMTQTIHAAHCLHNIYKCAHS